MNALFLYAATFLCAVLNLLIAYLIAGYMPRPTLPIALNEGLVSEAAIGGSAFPTWLPAVALCIVAVALVWKEERHEF